MVWAQCLAVIRLCIDCSRHARFHTRASWYTDMHVLPLFISYEPNSVFPRKAIIHEKVRAHPDTSASTDNVYRLARYHVHMADSKISVDKKSDPKGDLECLVMTQAPFITHFFLFFSSGRNVLMIDTKKI